MTKVSVRYHVATYSGTVDVFVDDDADDEHTVAKAKEQLRRRSDGSLPLGYQSFSVFSREECQ